MKYRKFFLIVVMFLFFNLMTACSQADAGTPLPTKVPTDPPVVATPTKTEKPTSTPEPTATPNTAATQKYDEFNVLLEKINSDGYIPSTVGETVELDPFKEEWAQINYYDMWPYGMIDSDFVFKANFNWSTASAKSDDSGCGVVFGGQENGDYYVVFLTNSSTRFFMKRGANLYNVGKTSGAGVQKFDNPAEAEFVLAVSDQKAYILVDGVSTLYTLSVDQTARGGFGLSLLSGTNKDYGTRCEATDMLLWTNEK
jgi:hypothetical protein